MRRLIEAIAFVALSGVVHLALAAIRPEPQGQNAMGEDGETVISLQAANASLSELVDRWDAPLELVDNILPTMVPPQMMLSRQEDIRPRPPSPPTARLRPTAPGLSLPSPDAMPERLTARSEKPNTMIESIASQRPKARPNRPKSLQPAAPKNKPAVTSPLQRASGSGGGSNAGSTDKTTSANLNSGQQRSLAAHWGAQLRTEIERRKRYPRSASGTSGTVMVRITVARDGSLKVLVIANSSGYQVLDQAALKAVQSVRRFPAAPEGLSASSYSFTVPMQFSN